MTELPVELDLYAPEPLEERYYAMIGAVDLAADQSEITWLTESGKRVAAIVPVEVAEVEMNERAADVVRQALGHFHPEPQKASEFSRLGRMDRRVVVNRRNPDLP